MTRSEARRAAIVAVGDELLSGQTTETNGSWLSERLAVLGVPVVKRWVVGDDHAEIGSAVSEGLLRADIVLVTGGLGPTADDLTRPAVASALGLELEVNEAVLDDLRARFRRRGFGEFPESNRVQAQVPRGGLVIPNRLGSAPGLWIAHEGRVVVLMPGVPREVYGMYKSELRDRIQRHFGSSLAPLVHRNFHTTGIAESALGERLDGVSSDLPRGVSLASLPYLGGVSIRISTSGSLEDSARLLDEAEGILEPILSPYWFAAEEGDLVEAVAAALGQRGMLLAVAESCTGGLLAKRITDRPGSSAFFCGGVVAYANESKSQLLGVDASMIEADGAVSRSVAERMASGVAERFAADVGIGITGVAGPDGGTDEKPVGTVWYAAAVRGRVVARHRIFPGDREAVRERAAQAALDLAFRMVIDER